MKQKEDATTMELDLGEKPLSPAPAPAPARRTDYSYEERGAIAVIRKAMLKKPEIITEIMRDQAYAQAGRLLMQAKTELAQLLEVNRAFIAAASILAKKQKADAVHEQDQQPQGENT